MWTKNCFSRSIIAKCRSKVLQNAPTYIKLPFVFKTFVLSIFEWLLKTGFTVSIFRHTLCLCLCFFLSLSSSVNRQNTS